MDAKSEFHTVDLLLDSQAETRAVDAFALSLIKAERQLRRLFTYLVYQNPQFGKKHVGQLRDALGDRRVYFEGFVQGFNALYPRSLEDIVGTDYDHYLARLSEAAEYRNKIFHGQITKKRLSRTSLIALVKDIRAWCEVLAAGASGEFGYDGFARNSYRKAPQSGLASTFKVSIATVDAYAAFITKNMERKPQQRGAHVRSPRDGMSAGGP